MTPIEYFIGATLIGVVILFTFVMAVWHPFNPPLNKEKKSMLGDRSCDNGCGRFFPRVREDGTDPRYDRFCAESCAFAYKAKQKKLSLSKV